MQPKITVLIIDDHPVACAARQTAELSLYEGDNHNISKFFTTAMDHTIAFFGSEYLL